MPSRHSAVSATRPVLDNEGLMETLEIVKDTEAMESFRRAVKQFEAGEGRDFEEFAAELGL